jgi:hypothetical protein
MSGIATIVEKLVLAAVVSEKAWMPRTSRADWALAALSVVLAAGGSLFLVLALDRYLGGVYPPYVAALYCTAALFIAALTAAAILAARRNRAAKTRLMGDNRSALAANINTMIASACGELEHPVRENPKTAMLVATLAGFFLANHHLRP